MIREKIAYWRGYRHADNRLKHNQSAFRAAVDCDVMNTYDERQRESYLKGVTAALKDHYPFMFN